MSSSMKMYDVFLNFRGEDTRTIFISHLYTALTNKSIRTYIDDQLNRGDDVWPELAKAIENSQVSIVVFSENYATSKWCLEELVKILQCRKKDHGQVVIPVFYKIDPTHIRKQTGTYEKAFATHERDLRNDEAVLNKVSKWKAALAEAANISGWDSQIHKDDSQIIEHIVNDVLQKLSLRCPDELKGIVTTQENCTKVESLMKRVQVIGIWGMGGIGKTTIAKILFAKLFPLYDKACFVANVKDYSHDMLLRELFKEETSTSNVVGSTFNMRRLSGKKVFIVLDNADMNSVTLLENLCKEYKDLSPHSRLIITTREKQLLTDRVDLIHEVDEWKRPESFQFFCSKAFNGSHPQSGFKDLSNRVVDYAGGVPLALNVLGSNLRSKNVEFWEETLKKLNKYPDKTIQTTLKMSYDGLDPLEKEIFLDIAFFFKGENKDRVIKILDACGFHASTGINVLEDKALITISNSKVIQIHDLLQQMGLEIVRELCSKDFGGRSRLRDVEEIHDVLGDNMGTGAIEGIILDLSQIKDIRLRVDTFTKMKNLRFLKFFVSSGQSYGNMHLPTVLGPFSNKLRYLEWNGYALASLPRDFCAKLLVEIRMPHSHVKQLWEGMQELDYLEGIELSECKQLLQLPDLSKATRLKWVNLSGCGSLSDLHTSVLSADTLVTLILDRCIKLESVKAKKHLKSLKIISVNGCSSLKEFAVSSDLMENLDLSNTRIETLDKSIGLLHSLKWFNLEDLRLKHLPKELSRLTCLKELKLSNSGIVIDKQQLHVLFDGLRSLQILHLKNCSNLFELPDNIGVLKQLQELRLNGSNVNSLPTNINHLEVLEFLSLENCSNLLCLPELPPLIKQLYAVNCKSLESISNLNVFARKMIGKTKHISFKNSLKLDGNSLYCIMESLHLTMVSAAFHNVSVRKELRYNYNSVQACFQGRKVPRQFSHQTTKSSIIIELPKRTNLLGLIYSVVLSPTSGVKKNGVKIQCQCLLAEGTKASWQNIGTTELKSDHVYVWYDPFHCDNILRFDEAKVCFEFSVTTDVGKVDCSISIKECGVHLISVSELYHVLPQLDLDSDKKKDLEKGLELELESGCSIERPHNKESEVTSNQIQNQRDLREYCSHVGEVVAESESVVVVPESSAEVTGRNGHVSDVVEKIQSAPKHTRAAARSGHRENTQEYTKAVKSKENEEMPTEYDAGLHLPVDSVNKENVYKDNSSETATVEPQMTQIEQVVTTSTHPVAQDEVAEETGEILGEAQTEIATVSGLNFIGMEDLSQMIEHDPLSILENLLSGKVSISSISQHIVAQSEIEVSSTSIATLLQDLENLLGSGLDQLMTNEELKQKMINLLEHLGQNEKYLTHDAIETVHKAQVFFKDLLANFPAFQKIIWDHNQLLQSKAELMQKTTGAKNRHSRLTNAMTTARSQLEDHLSKIEDLENQLKELKRERDTLQSALDNCALQEQQLKSDCKQWVSESMNVVLKLSTSESAFKGAVTSRKKAEETLESLKLSLVNVRK